MQRHFIQELDALKSRLIKMGSLAEQAIAESIRAFLERDAHRARKVIEEDEAINRLEMEIDNAVVDTLALQQPVAVDLRLILAAQKINNDLERIGDHAVNIAESALQYAAREPIDRPVDIPRMAAITKTMLREAIDAFVHSDSGLARNVLINDDEIDDLNRKTVDEMADFIRVKTDDLYQALDIIRVSRNLERVSDLATNIAEEVIFIAEARVVKHHSAEGPTK
ncbi:MAG TPA: phosphate signaling complex protein PhoU [Bacteroidota bacterium]|nr:phosphate signaling complex protein PhoU [Bacteroidota bacterium]